MDELDPLALRARPEQMTGSKSRMQGKVLLERSATPVYVGIDVCKARLDVYINPTGQKLTVSNDRDFCRVRHGVMMRSRACRPGSLP